MNLDDPSRGAEVKWWHLLAHAAAFAVAAGVGAFLVYPLYPVFEADTETASEAFGAFLTCVVIIGGIGPAITLVLFWLVGLTRRFRLRASDR